MLLANKNAAIVNAIYNCRTALNVRYYHANLGIPNVQNEAARPVLMPGVPLLLLPS